MGKEGKRKAGPEVNEASPQGAAVAGQNLLLDFVRSNILPLSLFSLALLVNLIVLWDYWGSPFARVPAWDGEVYWQWAQDIAAGNWLGNAIFHQSPLYPYFLALLMLLAGKQLLVVYLVQAVFSAASALLIYSITNKIQGNKTVGFIAGLLFAFYDFQLFYSLKVLSESLSIMLMLLATRLVLATDGEVKPRVALSAGLVFGLLLTAKPHLLIATPLLLLYFFIAKGNPTPRAAFAKAVMFLIPVVLIVSLVALRNYAVGNDFVLISSNGGENFYIGNHEKANGMYTYVEGISADIKYQNEDVNAVAQKSAGRSLKRSEVSKYWFAKGKKFILEHPREYLDLQVTKLKYIFSGAEVTNMYFLYFERANLTKSLALPFVNFYLLLPLFLAGLMAAISNWRSYFPLFCFALINMANLLLFFYDTRYMLLAMPYWIIFGATGLWSVWQAIRERKGGIAMMTPVVVLILGLALSAYIYVKDRDAIKPDSHLYLAMGDIYLELDQPDAALAAYRQSSNLNRYDWTPAFGAVKVCFRKGSQELAARLYEGSLPFVDPEMKKMVLRDKGLDPVREFIARKNQAGKSGAAAPASIPDPQSLLAGVPDSL